MNRNDKIVAVCENYTHDGQGVVKVDGFPLFVKGMLKGEKAEIVVTLAKKNYGFGRVLTILEPSIERIAPVCKVAKQCGGCQLQHMSYKEQLCYKRQKVQDVITRIAKLDMEVNEVIGMESYTNYRNKGQIPIGLQLGHVVSGFYRINSNTIVDTDTCMIQSERINEVLQCMKKLLEAYQNAKFFRHLLIKHAFATDEVMVVWITNKMNFANMEAMKNDLVQALPFVKSVVVNVNTRNDNVILGDKEYLLYGDRYITDKIHDLVFRISSKSFYQVNPKQTEVLYGKVLEFANLKGTETVLDLYCGVGTISMFLAKAASKVIGIEIVPQAIEDAKENAQLNGLRNIEFICNDASTYANEVSESGMKIDVIVVDPPRKGCDESTLESMIAISPSKIIYVSCDPATLARDLKVLVAHGYGVEVIQPTDMFPYSFHVESVVLLQRRSM